jgi:NADH pyrophosphatase NudC (nudix superfamily)
MTSPQFANRQNPKVYTQTGQQVYLSRACSVVAEVCLYEVTQAKWYILLVKRGEACPDFQGDWCLPCGYLDWDETLYQAMIREVYEETGLYLSELHRHPQCQATYPCNFAMRCHCTTMADLRHPNGQSAESGISLCFMDRLDR